MRCERIQGMAVPEVRPHFSPWRGTSRTASTATSSSRPGRPAPLWRGLSQWRGTSGTAIFASGLTILLAAMLTTSRAAEPLPGGLTLTDTTLAPQIWVHGMVERRFVIENPTPRTLPVEITLPASTYPGEGLADLSQTVLANAGTRTLAVMHQPPVRLRGPDLLRVNVARERPQEVRCQPTRFIDRRYYSSTPLLGVLVSKGLSAEDLKAGLITNAPAVKASAHGFRHASELSGYSRDKFFARLFTREYMSEIKPFRFEGDGAAWPRHWLAYSAFDSCLIAAADYERMPEDARSALRDYAAIGGHVAFMGMSALPGGWESDWQRNVASGVRLGEVTGIGFGRASTFTAAVIPALASNDLVRLVAGWAESARPWIARTDSNTDNLKEIPVAANVRVPARSFLAILLVFALLAGPGAVLYTQRTNRRIWLLAIVPGFSLLFSLAILIYALLSEGITPSLHRQSLTLLDQARRHAATFGTLGVYAPVSLRDGLHFDHGTEITPLSAVRSGGIAIGRGQHYVSGWVQPRMPAFFSLRRSETRAERLVVTSTATGVVEVVNALGAPILRLQLCDQRGNLFETRDLAPGERRALVSARKRLRGAAAVECQIRLPGQRASDAGWRFKDLAAKLMDEKADASLAPAAGTFVAVLDGAPFLEDPLAYCRIKATARSVVVGWHGEE